MAVNYLSDILGYLICGLTQPLLINILFVLKDDSRSADSRYGCTQQVTSGSRGSCTVTYRLNEAKYSGGTEQTISSVHVGSL